MFNICYVKQYFASFNTLIGWTFSGIYFRNISYFKFHIIFFLLCKKKHPKNISWSRKLNKYFLCFRFDIYFKINPVFPQGFKVINVKNLHSRNLKCQCKYCNANIFQLSKFCN